MSGLDSQRESLVNMQTSLPTQSSSVVMNPDKFLALDWMMTSVTEIILHSLSLLNQDDVSTIDLAMVREDLKQLIGAFNLAQLDEPLLLCEVLSQIILQIERNVLSTQVCSEIVVGLDVLAAELEKMLQSKHSQSITIYRVMSYLRTYLPQQTNTLQKVEIKEQDMVSLIMHKDYVLNPHPPETRDMLVRAYRHLLCKLFDGEQTNTIYEGLYKVLSTLLAGAQSLHEAALMRVACILHDAVLQHTLAYSDTTRQLFIRLERSLSNHLSDTTLLADMLDLFEQANVYTSGASVLRKMFGLYIPEKAIQTPGLLQAVVRLVKHARQLLAVSNNRAEAIYTLQEADRLLNMAGWNNLASETQRVILRLEASTSMAQQTDPKLVQAFLDLETMIGHMSDVTAQLGDTAHQETQASAIRQLHGTIEHVKQAFTEYNQNQWQAHILVDVSAQLQTIQTSLHSWGMERAAELVHTLNILISNTVSTVDYKPTWLQMDAFAECLVLLEHYLEELAAQKQNNAVLDALEVALSQANNPEDIAKPTAVAGDKVYDDFALATHTENSIEANELIPTTEPKETTNDNPPENQAQETNIIQLQQSLTSPTIPLEPVFEPITPLAELDLATIQSEAHTNNPSIDLTLTDVIATTLKEDITENNASADTDKAIQAIVVPLDDTSVDEELTSIFAEELAEIMPNLNEHFKLWETDADNLDALVSVRRNFHTLKGSGRMVGANVLGELCWAIERLLNKKLEGIDLPTDHVIQLISQVIQILPALAEKFMQKSDASVSVKHFIFTAQALIQKQPINLAHIEHISNQYWGENTTQESVVIEAHKQEATPLIEETPVSTEIKIDNEPIPALAQATTIVPALEKSYLEPQLLSIFLAESDTYLEHIAAFIADQTQPKMVTDALTSALHTLRGSAGMLEISPIYQIASAMETDCLKNKQNKHAISTENVLALQAGHTQISAHINVLRAGNMPVLNEQDKTVITLLKSLSEHHHTTVVSVLDEKLLGRHRNINHLLALNIDSLLNADIDLPKKLNNQHTLEYIQELNTQLKTLENAVQQDESLSLLQRICHDLQKVYHQQQQVLATNCPVSLQQALVAAHETLLTLLDDLAAHLDLHPIENCLTALKVWMQPITAPKKTELVEESFNHVQLSEPLATEETSSSNVSLTASEDYYAATVKQETPAVEQALVLRKTATVSDTELSPLNATQQKIPETLLSATLSEPKLRAQTTTDLAVSAQSTNHNFYEPLDEDMRDIFLEEADEILEAMNAALEDWQQAPNDAALRQLQRQLHTLKGNARMVKLSSLADMCHELETLYDYQMHLQQPKPLLTRLFHFIHEQIGAELTHLHMHYQLFDCTPTVQLMQQYHASLDDTVLMNFFEKENQLLSQDTTLNTLHDITHLNANAEEAEPQELEQPAENVLTTEPTHELKVSSPIVDNTLETPQIELLTKPTPPQKDKFLSNLEVLAEQWDIEQVPQAHVQDIFLEDAANLIISSQTCLQAWLEKPEQKVKLVDLQHYMHTLTGGAHLANFNTLGEMTLALEKTYEWLQQPDTPLLVQVQEHVLQNSHEWLTSAIRQLDQGLPLDRPEVLTNALQNLREPLAQTRQPDINSLAIETLEINSKSSVETERAAPQIAITPTTTPIDIPVFNEPPPMEGLFATLTDDTANKEVVRVPAVLLEKLINLSGEDSIYRTRVEMQVGGLTASLTEMGSAIQRIAEQLRRMEGELESQIRSRHEKELEVDATFDPLEMDQYSALNQLSKSLSESASDLQDFKATLGRHCHDSAILLHQQSRIQTEIQDQLMNSRLVPFSRILPRLQRLVRQLGSDLQKEATLKVVNSEGQLDRVMLDKLVIPLEHMLRNAMDHGVENTALRIANKKPEVAQLTLTIEHKGGNVLIRLEDDGQGINIEAIKAKAISKGLLDSKLKLSSQNALQLIFLPGLSTAEQLSQISGRGVGMDVVQAEIKQLGGDVAVESHTGLGAAFTLTLPLTVALTDALKVKVGRLTYAIPLSQIEKIITVSSKKLLEHYQSKARTWDIEGIPYHVRPLAEIVHADLDISLFELQKQLPLIVVRHAGESTALQVDQLIGSRTQIVVKPIGQQLAFVKGIAGATIEGNGSVTLVLDTPALARQLLVSQQHYLLEQPAEPQHRIKTIMVVDDSVTVRKVTTRVLERAGFQVVTAFDGIDALETLEDVTPDLLILDIEMPRMDGFELASRVKRLAHLNHLPMIMITSRTGEKHREKAFQCGVDCYMGKPFKEPELLQTVQELLVSQT